MFVVRTGKKIDGAEKKKGQRPSVNKKPQAPVVDPKMLHRMIVVPTGWLDPIGTCQLSNTPKVWAPSSMANLKQWGNAVESSAFKFLVKGNPYAGVLYSAKNTRALVDATVNKVFVDFKYCSQIATTTIKKTSSIDIHTSWYQLSKMLEVPNSYYAVVGRDGSVWRLSASKVKGKWNYTFTDRPDLMISALKDIQNSG